MFSIAYSRNDPGVWLAYFDTARQAYIGRNSQPVENLELDVIWSLKFWPKMSIFIGYNVVFLALGTIDELLWA